MDQTFMKEKPVLPLVLKMALPIVLSMLINSLYNIVDSYFVAQWKESAMTAVSLVFPLQNLANAVGIGFGVGINAAVAFYLGAERYREADRASTLGVILSAVHGVLLAGLCALLIAPFLRMFTGDEETIAYGLEYFYVVIAFSPVLTLSLAFEKILQATGKMVTTMFCMAVGRYLRVILDPIFISGLGPIPEMGVMGAALATGIGQCLSLLAYLIVFWRRTSPSNSASASPRRRRSPLKLYAVGIPRLAQHGAALLHDHPAQRHPRGVCGDLCAHPRCLLQIADLHLLYGERHRAGHPPPRRLQPRRGTKRPRAFHLPPDAASEHRRDGGGHHSLPCHPAAAHGAVSQTQETIEAGASALRIISAGFVVSALSVVISGTFEGRAWGCPRSSSPFCAISSSGSSPIFSPSPSAPSAYGTPSG